MPPNEIVEIVDDDNNENNKFMIGFACVDHRNILEKKFLLLQSKGLLPGGKVVFTTMKIIQTNCIKGTLDDMDEVTLNRLGK
jgi:hypothetical protein